MPYEPGAKAREMEARMYSLVTSMSDLAFQPL